MVTDTCSLRFWSKFDLLHFFIHLVLPFNILHHKLVAGYYGFTLEIHVSACPSICISFLDDKLSKHKWIFTKFGMCIDIVEIWFGIANGQFSSNFDEFSARDMPIFLFRDDNSSKHQWIFTKLGMTCIDIVEIWFGITSGQILLNFGRVTVYLPETCPYFRFQTIT